MSLSLGIVGLPNVGKSTLFNALTKSQVLAANYPFATIEPNTGIVAVPDEKLTKLAQVSNSAKTVAATVTLTDIAGIVEGAAAGAGLGNKFLSHIRSCNAIVQVVRVFEDSNIAHVTKSIEPKADIDTINTELALADIETLQRRAQKLEKEAKTSKDAQAELAIVSQAVKLLNSGSDLLASDELRSNATLAQMQLLTIKPIIYVFNVDEQTLNNTEKISDITTLAKGRPSVILCAQLEADLIDLNEEEKMTLMSELGQTESGLDKLARIGYETLNLQSFYTSGIKESRAWTIKQGFTAPQAAGVIHTDFEKGFIKAEIVSYADFIKHEGWGGSRQAGAMRLEGKDYVISADDVVEFKFNV